MGSQAGRSETEFSESGGLLGGCTPQVGWVGGRKQKQENAGGGGGAGGGRGPGPGCGPFRCPPLRRCGPTDRATNRTRGRRRTSTLPQRSEHLLYVWLTATMSIHLGHHFKFDGTCLAVAPVLQPQLLNPQ